MVRDLGRQGPGTADSVQDVEVQRVSGSADGAVHDAGRGRRLSLRAVLFHDGHVQAGRRSAEGCGICKEGLEGALAPAEKVRPQVPGDEMVEGSGADEKDAAASAPGDRASSRKDKVLWS